MKTLKVCFVIPGFYPLLNTSVEQAIGGSERRALIFAKGLARKERYEVSAVAFDHGQPQRESYDGITVYRDDSHCVRGPTSYPRPRWLTGLQARLGRIRALVSAPPSAPAEADAWAAAGADVYCIFGVTDYAARLANWCRSVERPLVLFAGSDTDFSDKYRPDSKKDNGLGSRCDLCYDSVMKAHTIVVQTQTQARLLSSRFGRQGVVIANPVDLNGALPLQPSRRDRSVLWIGKSSVLKRPELVIELARMCPNVPFTMVLNRASPEIFEQIIATRPPNVELIERVPPRDIFGLYQHAFALLSTATSEGFPNTFLEAGKYAVPVLTLTVDPDGVISRHDAGVAAGGDLLRLAEAIRQFHADPARTRQAGQNLQEYVRHHHALPDRIVELDRLLQGFIQDGYPSSAPPPRR